jgi:hypothetical protein
MFGKVIVSWRILILGEHKFVTISPSANPLLLMHTNAIITEPFEIYRARSKDFLTSHQLGDYRRCPQLYHKKKLGKIEDEDRPAYLVGRALHTLALEGRKRFEEEFVVGGPINPKTGEMFGPATKAWTEWAEAQGKPVLTLAQFDMVEKMAESVRSHTLATDLLSSGVPEAVIRSIYRDIPCQIRMDWFDVYRCLVDLKSCDDITWFESDARRYGYMHQVAFYRAIVMQAIGIPIPVHFIAVEKKEPFRCGIWQVNLDILAQAQRENEAAIERLKRSQMSNTWPSGYEECRVFAAI